MTQKAAILSVVCIVCVVVAGVVVFSAESVILVMIAGSKAAPISPEVTAGPGHHRSSKSVRPPIPAEPLVESPAAAPVPRTSEQTRAAEERYSTPSQPPVKLQYNSDGQVVGVRQGQIYYDPSSGQVTGIQQGPVTYSPTTGQVQGYSVPGAFIPIQ